MMALPTVSTVLSAFHLFVKNVLFILLCRNNDPERRLGLFKQIIAILLNAFE